MLLAIIDRPRDDMQQSIPTEFRNCSVTVPILIDGLCDVVYCTRCCLRVPCNLMRSKVYIEPKLMDRWFWFLSRLSVGYRFVFTLNIDVTLLPITWH